MSCLVKNHIGKYTYVYESRSFRDARGRPQNDRRRVGKVDPGSGLVIYDAAYLRELADRGSPFPKDALLTECGTNDEELVYILDSVKSYGAMHLLREIGKQEGVLPLLEDLFPKSCDQIFGVAAFMLCSSDAMLYYDDWAAEQDIPEHALMSSQRMSEFLDSISEKERSSFYQKWMQHLSSGEYVALDITSISSYSELIEGVEYGYNRDNEKLPQINVCMLFGERSELPVYQIAYSGSLNDVSTFLTTIDEVQALVPNRTLKIVMDKGLYSEANLLELMARFPDVRFLVPVPFSTAFACKAADCVRAKIDDVTNAVVTGAHTIRGVHKVRSWGSKGKKLHTFIYYDPETYLRAANELYQHVHDLEQAVFANPDPKKRKKDCDKYLVIRASSRSASGITVSIRKDVVDDELRFKGWLVLISNEYVTPESALEVYRHKDVVEKSFDRLKNGFGLGRLRVHSDQRAENKLFIGFIAQILLSSLDRRMRDADLFKKYTIQKALKLLSRLKLTDVGQRKFWRPATAEQRKLLKSLGVSDL